MNPAAGDVTRQDAARALPVYRTVAAWMLDPARWAGVSKLVTAALAAIARNDQPALQAALDDITLLGPVRTATASATIPPPGEVRADLAALTAVLAELAGTAGPAVPVAAADGDSDTSARGISSTVPVSIYLGDEAGHETVQAAVEELARASGLAITERDDPVPGSWFRQMVAKLAGLTRSPAAREAFADAAHRAEIELVRRAEAEVTALLMANTGPLIASLGNTQDAVVRIGAVLIVKHGGALYVNQLTARQQLVLNHSPHLLTAPDKILKSLGLPLSEAASLPADPS